MDDLRIRQTASRRSSQLADIAASYYLLHEKHVCTASASYTSAVIVTLLAFAAERRAAAPCCGAGAVWRMHAMRPKIAKRKKLKNDKVSLTQTSCRPGRRDDADMFGARCCRSRSAATIEIGASWRIE